MPAVVAALHDDEVVASGDRPGQADRLRRRLAPAVEQTNPLHPRDVRAQQLGQLPLDLRRPGAEKVRALVDDPFDRTGQPNVPVTEKLWSKGAVEVDVFVAFSVLDARALRLDEGDIGLGDAVHRRDAAGDEELVVLQDLVRVGVFGHEGGVACTGAAGGCGVNFSSYPDGHGRKPGTRTRSCMAELIGSGDGDCAPAPSHTTGHTVFPYPAVGPGGLLSPQGTTNCRNRPPPVPRASLSVRMDAILTLAPTGLGPPRLHRFCFGLLPVSFPFPSFFSWGGGGKRTLRPGTPGNLWGACVSRSSSFAPWSFGPLLQRRYPPSSLLWPLLTSPSLSRRSPPQVRCCFCPFIPSGSTSHVSDGHGAFTVASKLTAPYAGLSADSCSYGQRFVPRFLQLGRAACAPRLPPCGSLRLPPSVPVSTLQLTRNSPCWAHWRKPLGLPRTDFSVLGSASNSRCSVACRASPQRDESAVARPVAAGTQSNQRSTPLSRRPSAPTTERKRSSNSGTTNSNSFPTAACTRATKTWPTRCKPENVHFVCQDIDHPEGLNFTAGSSLIADSEADARVAQTV